MRLCAYKPNSVEDYSSDDHIPGMSVTTHLVRLSIEGFTLNIPLSPKPSIARPCTQVRILPFHPICFHIGYSRRNPLAFAYGVSARTSMSFLTRRALPATLLQAFDLGVFGLSSPQKSEAIIMRKYYNTKLQSW